MSNKHFMKNHNPSITWSIRNYRLEDKDAKRYAIDIFSLSYSTMVYLYGGPCFECHATCNWVDRCVSNYSKSIKNG